MEWDEFLNYMHVTSQVAQLREILQTNPNDTSDTDSINFQQQLQQHESCMILNTECTSALDKIENSLLGMKDNLNVEIEAIQFQIKKEYQKFYESNHNWPYIFGIPYFKDQDSFSPPPNSDTVNMKARNFISTVNLPPGHLWKAEDKTFLLNSVKRYTIQKIKKVSQLHPKIDKIKALDLNETDWAQISLKNLKDRHGLLECIGMWNSYLNPRFNKNKWTREEENRLKICASKYNYEDWEAIARELNTNRSSYQCIVHLQTRFNKDVTKKKWTEEEDRQLEKLVQQYQLGGYIPWAKVASHMVGRTKFQVYNHWAYTLQPNIKKGRFTKLEDAIILAGIKKFGTDYGRISRFLKDRTSIQIRNRFNTFLQYQRGFEPWTSEEDVLLLKLVKTFGKGNWSQISNSFRNRNRTQLRHRYTAIMNWIKKNPDKELNVQHRRVHSKIGGPQEIWESILNESDLEEDNITEVINEMGLEDVTRDKTQKYVPHMIAAKFLDLLKAMYIMQDGESELKFSKDEILSFCGLLERQLKLLQCLTPFNWNYIANDSTFFECTNSVLQAVNQTLCSSRLNDICNHTANEVNNSGNELYVVPLSSDQTFSESDICNHTETEVNNSENELYVVPLSSDQTFSESDALNCNLNSTLMKIRESSVQNLFNPLPFLNTSTPENTSVEELNDNAVYNNFEMQNTDANLSSHVNGDLYDQHVNSGANTGDVPTSNKQEDFEVRHSENQEINFNFTHPTSFDTLISNSGNENDLEQIDNDVRYIINVSDSSELQCPNGVRKYINVLMNSSSALSEDCEISSLAYYIPPSHTTLVGFYTLFLNFDIIKKCAAHKPNIGNAKGTKRVNSPKHLSEFTSSDTERAIILWKQRFFSVFLWPKLMSINGPEHAFNNQLETNLLSGKTSRGKGVKKTTRLKTRDSQQKQKLCPDKVAVKTKVNMRPTNHQVSGNPALKTKLGSKHLVKNRRRKQK